MKAVDSNVIIRFLVKDVEEQSERVLRLVKSGETLYINEIVLSEIYWVLTKVYEYQKNDFIKAIDILLEIEGITFFDSITVRKALTDFIHTNCGFIDCLIHRANQREGLKTLTFDQRALKLYGMEMLE